MDKMVVKGGRKLGGQVRASGAKNSALPLIFSTLLAEGEHVFHNVPDLVDIKSACQLLEQLGCETFFDKDHTLRIFVKPNQNFRGSLRHRSQNAREHIVSGPAIGAF